MSTAMSVPAVPGSSSPFDSRQLRQALAILDRERPSPSEWRLFALLNLAVWATFLLTLVWMVVFVAGYVDLQRRLLIAALGCFGVAVGAFLASTPLVRKAWRAGRMEWRLGISRPLSALMRRAASGSGWWHRGLGGAAAVVLLPGAVLAIVSALALVGELWSFPPDMTYLPGTVAIFVFGLACASLYPVYRVNQRLEAASALHARLVEHQDLDEAGRDLVVALERTQILLERQRGAAGRRTSRQWRLRLEADVQAALARHDPHDMGRIYAALGTLLARATATTGTTTADGRAQVAPDVQDVDVPETTLSLTCVRDDAAREVVVTALRHRLQGIDSGARHEPFGGGDE